jgi:hypothetical protein
MPSTQGFEEVFEVCCAFAFGNIKDSMSFEITEGGGEAAAFVKGVFVDTEHLRALTRESLFGFTLSELMVDAFNGCGSKVSESSKTRSADPVVVIAVDALAEGLG